MTDMEGAKWNLRECYVRLWRYDLYGRGSSPRDDRGVFVAMPELRAADHVLEYGDVFKTTIKCESDKEVSVTARNLNTVLEHAREDSVHDPGWLVEEVDDFVTENELNADMVKVKQELEMGPTMLQLQTAHHPSLTQEDDFVVKMEEIDETMVKQELDIGPTVLQPLPMPRAQASPNPRPGTSSGDCGVPVALRTAESHTWNAFASPTSRLKAQVDYCDKITGSPSICQRALSEHSDDCTGGEDTAEDKRDDGQQCECNNCRDTTTRNSSLIDHLQRRICEKTLKVELSQNAYRLTDLKRHPRTSTREKRYKCEHCDYSASYSNNFKRHMRIHTGEKPYKCEHCDYRTSHSSQLKSHMLTHTGEKSYKCEQCEYRAWERRSIKRHMRTHTGEKPYKCEKCDHTTSQLTHLKRHMHTHTGEKPYKCEQCDYSSPHLSYLKIHIRTHAGEKPYKCEQCDYSASQSSNLKTHAHS